MLIVTFTNAAAGELRSRIGDALTGALAKDPAAAVFWFRSAVGLGSVDAMRDLGIALLGPFLGIALPLTVIQMLWINLIMDTMAALALATEPPNPELLKHPPRNPSAFIVTGKMAFDIFFTAALFIGIFIWYALTHTGGSGISPEDRCIIFSGFVMLQFWNLLNVKCFGASRSVFTAWKENPTFWIIAAIIPVGQILITQFGGRMFGTVPLDFGQWIRLIGCSALVLAAGEIIRLVARLSGKR